MSSDVLKIISKNAKKLASSGKGVICIFIYHGEKESIPPDELAVAQLMQAPDGQNWIAFQSAEQNTSQKCRAPFLLFDADEIPFCHARFETADQALELATSYAAVSTNAKVLTIFTVAYAIDSDEYTIESIKVIGDANQEESDGLTKNASASFASANQSGKAASAPANSSTGTWMHENRYFLIALACAVLLLLIVLIASVIGLRKKIAKVAEKQQEKVVANVRPSKNSLPSVKKQVKSPQSAANRVSVTDRRSIKEPVQMK